MKFLLATKVHMTQVFDGAGRAVPVTVLSAPPMVALQVKTKEKDGYRGVQFGFGTRRAKNISKPQLKHMKDAGTFRYLREFRTDDTNTLHVGDSVNTSLFSPGDVVHVSGITKGKGFQGVVKRYGFKGGRRTHGQKHSEREPGSIGATWPQRVIKGRRMAGRMGGDKITVKNLKVMFVDTDNNLLLVSGAVPGRRGTLVVVRGK